MNTARRIVTDEDTDEETALFADQADVPALPMRTPGVLSDPYQKPAAAHTAPYMLTNGVAAVILARYDGTRAAAKEIGEQLQRDGLSPSVIPAYQIIAWASQLKVSNIEQPHQGKRGGARPRKNGATTPERVPCPICGEPFTPRHKGRGVVSTYCSLKCAGAAKRTRKAEISAEASAVAVQVDPHPAAAAAAPPILLAPALKPAEPKTGADYSLLYALMQRLPTSGRWTSRESGRFISAFEAVLDLCTEEVAGEAVPS